MRVLASTTAGAGHLGPLVPFARALVDAGHEVVMAAPASFGPAVEQAGFTHHPFADGPEDELAAAFARLPDCPTTTPTSSWSPRSSGGSTPGPPSRG